MADVIVHVGTLGLAAATTGALAVYAWRRPDVPGARSFVWLVAAFTGYSLAHLLGLLTAEPAARRVLEYLQWTATMAIPVCWLAFAFAYTGHDEFIARRPLGLLAAVPAGVALLGWTNPAHGLVWAVNRPTTVDGTTIVLQEFGPAFWLGVAYVYACILVGTALLVRLAVLSEYLYADQTLLLAVGVAVPVVGSLLSVLRIPPATRLDVTPYTFTLSGLAFGHAVFRYRLFDLVPATRRLGRRAAIADLDDGVVVLDDVRRVVYLNPVAADVFDCEPATVLGEPVTALADAPVDFDAPDALAEVAVDGRTYEIRASTITGRRDREIGHTLVVSDVTERVRRERTLRRQRDELATVERVNAVVREINRALVGARTREQVLAAVCEQLVDSELYDGAWVVDEIGAVATEDVADAPDTVEGSPSTVAFRDGGRYELGATDLETDGTATPPDEQCHWTSVPLVHCRTAYGALVLATTRADGIGERELAVLDELGELIGHAINAAEKEKLLVADTVLELELAVPAAEEPLCALAERVAAELELRSLVPVGDGVVVYLGTDGGPVQVEDATDLDHVTAVRSLDGGDGVVEVRLTGGSALVALREVGANVTDLRASGDRCRLVAEVAADTDVRGLLDRLELDVPGVELYARRERTVEPLDGLEDDHLTGDLTERQREALRAAYAAGYFDWPRASTAEELADTMDIAAPTLHSHLRKAQNKLLAEVFEADREDA